MASKYAEKFEETLRDSGAHVARAITMTMTKRFFGDGGTMVGAPLADQREKVGELVRTRVADIKVVVGGYEIPMVEILKTLEDHYVSAFDEAVASAAKDVIFLTKLDDIEDALGDALCVARELKENLNGEVGQRIQKVLGENSNWTESSFTC